MGKIVGIGGGSMEALETLAIDKEVVALSGARRPRALFIPTASGDSPERWGVFQRVYGERLGCRTDVLFLLRRQPSAEELQTKLLESDIIYVGGGNTLMMMRRWRRLGVDGLLRQAYRKGTVLAGSSAGMICWYAWGHSDSMSFYHPDNWRYIRVRGMGLVNAFGCPHYDSATGGKAREIDFQGMFMKHPGLGIAVDERCALAVVDGGYRVIAARPGAGAYLLRRRRGSLDMEPLAGTRDLLPMAALAPGEAATAPR